VNRSLGVCYLAALVLVELNNAISVFYGTSTVRQAVYGLTVFDSLN
jgi:hypothetical protein